MVYSMKKEIVARSDVHGLKSVYLIAYDDGKQIIYVVTYGRNKIQTLYLEVAKKKYYDMVLKQMDDKLI